MMIDKISGGFVYCEKCQKHHYEAFVCGNFGEFSVSKEHLEKHGITEEMLQTILIDPSKIPEGYMEFGEAVKWFNNLVMTSPLWRGVYEKFSVDRGLTREFRGVTVCYPLGDDLNRE